MLDWGEPRIHAGPRSGCPRSSTAVLEEVGTHEGLWPPFTVSFKDVAHPGFATVYSACAWTGCSAISALTRASGTRAGDPETPPAPELTLTQREP